MTDYVELDCKDLAPQAAVFRVKLLNSKQWSVRLWIAVKLINLAARIAWLRVEIEY